LSFYEGVGVLKIEELELEVLKIEESELESELLCTDSTALVITCETDTDRTEILSVLSRTLQKFG
jgi:hypothetical protein